MPERNELFFPGRMAYTMDLDDVEETHDDPDSANPHSDIPTTTIRSKADVQGNLAHQQAVSLSANDIVINKLTQILSYLRAAGSRGKKKKKDKLIPQLPNPKSDPVAAAAISKGQGADIPIFDDAGEYVPDYKRTEKGSSNYSSRDKDRDRRDKDRGYSRSSHRDRERDRDRRDHKAASRSYFDKQEEADEYKKGFSNQDKEMIKTLLKREEEKSKKEINPNKEDSGGLGQHSGTYLSASNPEGYSECYPGIDTSYAMDDSDEEVDYTKMDLGNKKGPVGRWDFDTAEEYADYMSQKEALPKAAFQYGVKMAEGRKTRGRVGMKNEKAKLDKEWNKISSLIDKRKGPGSGAKRAKYE